MGRRRAGLADYAVGAGRAGRRGGCRGARRSCSSDIDWAIVPVDARARRARGTAIGLAAAVPVAAVFGGLLMRGRPRLRPPGEPRASTSSSARWSRTGPVIVLWAWLAAGVLRVLVPSGRRRARAAAVGGRLGLGEVGTVLVVVDLLFLAFVAVQFRYLFGGAELVRGADGLSYAEYARRGFFELVAVAALSLPLLLRGRLVAGPAGPAARAPLPASSPA